MTLCLLAGTSRPSHQSRVHDLLGLSLGLCTKLGVVSTLHVDGSKNVYGGPPMPCRAVGQQQRQMAGRASQLQAHLRERSKRPSQGVGAQREQTARATATRARMGEQRYVGKHVDARAWRGRMVRVMAGRGLQE